MQYLVTRHTVNLEGLRLLSATAGPLPDWPTRLWALPEALPRAYWVGRAVEGERPVDLMRRVFEDPSFDPQRAVLLPGLAVSGAAPTDRSAEAGRARILALAPDAIEVETEAAADGYLVVTDGFAPGWWATVDGRPTPILRANVVFRAVRVAAGRHRIVMRYRPAAIPIGVGLSLLGLAATLAAWARDRSRG